MGKEDGRKGVGRSVGERGACKWSDRGEGGEERGSRQGEG